MADAAGHGDRLTAQVVPLLRVRHLGDRRFDYLVPESLAGVTQIGSVVGVSFGSRKVRGVVLGVSSRPPDEVVTLKPVESVEERRVPAELVILAQRLADRYVATLESCLRLVVPPRPGPVGRLRRPSHKGSGEGSPEGSLDPCSDGEALILTGEQQQALDVLVRDLERPDDAHRQLWGVTGSGKTELYLRLARLALDKGAGVIMLVPEIALTPLMIERVRGRLGDNIGVIHSGLTAAQRRREYGRIADGQVRVVVGARSAVFAPIDNLKLVILDESHDTSYKQEEAPGYHVATVARLRLEGMGGLLLEGSASPAVEAMIRPEECVRLRERPRGALPKCEVVDMRQQAHSGVLAASSREALAQTLRRGEQAIVLLNRRGYSGYVHCGSCGHVMTCEDCELALTYHSKAQRLLCHHCGRSYRQPRVCPSCEQAPVVRGGPGTERLADELARLLPEEHIFRLDSDVLTSGAVARGVLEEFSASHPAILVGTQMVAKGHDFPDVTMVVVADADTALYMSDFRAAERTFQLLTQVSGRAGRADRPGRVIVQTWNPDVPCIRMALERDEEGFYSRELGFRQRLGYPPFSQLIRLITAGEKAHSVRLAAQHLADGLRPHFSAEDIRGPAKLPGLRGKTRWHIVLSASDGERARAIVAQAVGQLSEPYRLRGVRLVVDVDPFSFM